MKPRSRSQGVVLKGAKVDLLTTQDVPALLEALINFIGLERIKKSVASWRKSMKRASQARKRQLQAESFHWWLGFTEFWECQESNSPYTVRTLCWQKTR